MFLLPGAQGPPPPGAASPPPALSGPGEQNPEGLGTGSPISQPASSSRPSTVRTPPTLNSPSVPNWFCLQLLGKPRRLMEVGGTLDLIGCCVPVPRAQNRPWRWGHKFDFALGPLPVVLGWGHCSWFCAPGTWGAQEDLSLLGSYMDFCHS